MKCSSNELNVLDLGTHMGLMEEWNESTTFNWDEATVLKGVPYTAVIHPYTVDYHGDQGVMVMVYDGLGEGDLLSLRVYDRTNKGAHDYYGVELDPDRKPEVPYEVQVKQHQIERQQATIRQLTEKIQDYESRIRDAQDRLG